MHWFDSRGGPYRPGTDADESYGRCHHLCTRPRGLYCREWKVAITAKPTAAGRIVAIPPDRSDNPTTMRVNQFAADIYPIVDAHLEAAKALERSLEKRHSRP